MKFNARTIFLSALATMIVLLALEMLARIVDTVAQDVASTKTLSSTNWLRYSPDLGWERRPGFKGSAGLADREFDAAGYFAVDSRQITDSAGRKRVVFLGDSNTFGFGTPTADSFVEVADRLLPDVDMINLGVIGYSSYQGHLTLEKHLPLLKPDLVVVSFNFNDRRYVAPPDEVDSQQEFQRVYRASESTLAATVRALNTSYLYRGLGRLLRWIGVLPKPVTEVKITLLKPRVDEASYRRNLTLIAQSARRAGIPVLFMLLRDDPMLSEHLRLGIASLGRHDYDKAIAYLNSVVRSRTMFSELARVYLAEAYEAKGDSAKAAETAVINSVYRSFSGGTLIRPDTDYNDIMRQVAEEYGMPLLDSAAVLEKQPSVFIDFCHFNAEGHRLLGTQLASRISGILGNGKQAAPR